MTDATTGEARQLARRALTFGRLIIASAIIRNVVLTALYATLTTTLFLVLQPELFGMTPNGLDPLFYTGYAINFDDLQAIVGNSYYFVSRWSAYGPNWLISLVVGPTYGRTLCRAISLVLIFYFFHLTVGREKKPAPVLLGCVVLVTQPFFVRPLMTDYVEWVILVAGTLGLLVSLRPVITTRHMVLMGIFAGAIVVANPLAATVAVGPSIVAFSRHRTWFMRLRAAVVLTASGTAFVAAGWLYFRLVLKVQNVYAPTLRFVGAKAGRDPLRASDFAWMNAYLWIYLPMLFLVALGISWGVSSQRRSKQEVVIGFLVALQYCFQLGDHFIRNGNGLEISYYWSYMAPSLAVGIGVVVTRRAEELGARACFGLLIVWLAILRTGLPDTIRLPFLLAVFNIAIGVGVLFFGRKLLAGIISLFVVLLAFQIATPWYEPLAHGKYDTQPRFGELFGQSEYRSDLVFSDTVWLARQMDRLPDDATSTFVVLPGNSMTAVAIYAPYVTNRVFHTGFPITADVMELMGSRLNDNIVLWGPSDLVAPAAAELRARYPVLRTVKDAQHRGGHQTRIIALNIRNPGGSRVWESGSLPRMHGRTVGNDILVDAGTAAGLVTYGPYVPIAPGAYVATIRYSSAASATIVIGWADVFIDGALEAARVPMYGTSGRPSRAVLPFTTGEAGTLEIRVARTAAEAQLTLKRVELSPSQSK